MEADKNNPYQLYCWEFQNSLMPYDDGGNWFGRLIAYKGKINISSQEFDQEVFQNLMETKGIEIIEMETDFPNVQFEKEDINNPSEYQSGTITSQVKIKLKLNDEEIDANLRVTHLVKPAFQTKMTNIG